jgi:RNA polymerase sigma-70 factor (ECF subfamily)
MKHSRRVEIFEQLRAEYTGFLTSVLWKLTGDKELLAEALQYSLLAMWRNVEKLNGSKAGAYIYKIALSANSKAWQNRLGRDGQFTSSQLTSDKLGPEKAGENELAQLVRQAIAKLPTRQARAVVMRYLQQQDYKDIAQKLGCSEAGARSHVSKALTALKDKLAYLAEETD